jgi:hypothetical protein
MSPAFSGRGLFPHLPFDRCNAKQDFFQVNGNQSAFRQVVVQSVEPRGICTTVNKLRKGVCAFLALERQKPGFPLQFLAPLRGLRDFRFNPLRPTGFLRFAQSTSI